MPPRPSGRINRYRPATSRPSMPRYLPIFAGVALVTVVGRNRARGGSGLLIPRWPPPPAHCAQVRAAGPPYPPRETSWRVAGSQAAWQPARSGVGRRSDMPRTGFIDHIGIGVPDLAAAKRY